jgi:hypothetical protein
MWTSVNFLMEVWTEVLSPSFAITKVPSVIRNELWACLFRDGTEQHSAVTVYLIFLLLFYIFYYQSTSKHSHFFHFLYHINIFLLLFK